MGKSVYAPSFTAPFAPREAFAYIYADAQWEALCSAPREEIIQFLRARGPCSLAELAHAMDAAPDGLYHHIERLVSAGFVREVGIRRVGKQVERIFDLVAQRVRLDVDVAAGRNTPRLVRMLRAAVRRAESAFGAALASRTARIDEPGPDTMLATDVAWLDDAALEKVRRHLAVIRRLCEEGRARRRGRLHLITVVMSPLVRGRGVGVRPTARLAALERAE